MKTELYAPAYEDNVNCTFGLRIVIPLKPQSWNVLVRKHYRVVQNFKDQWHQNVQYQVLKNKIKPVTQYPVTLFIEAHWMQKRRHDIDALCTKFAVDALVNLGILVDDDITHVNKVVFTGMTGCETDELVITIKNTPL
jgi:Holliday junction resolvase RusA-like endonuclease